MTNENPNPKTWEQLGGYWTIAVFDVDSRSGSITKGNNGDAQLICSINRDTGNGVRQTGRRLHGFGLNSASVTVQKYGWHFT